MADMHILTGDGLRWTVVMHFTVPGGTNAAGISWTDALVNSGQGGTTSLPDGDGTGGTIDATEKAAVLAGTVAEHSASFLIESGGSSGANVQAALREFYATQKTAVQAALQRRLKYFGATESEA